MTDLPLAEVKALTRLHHLRVVSVETTCPNMDLKALRSWSVLIWEIDPKALKSSTQVARLSYISFYFEEDEEEAIETDKEDEHIKIQDKEEEGDLAPKQRISSNPCFYFFSYYQQNKKGAIVDAHNFSLIGFSYVFQP